MSGVNRHCVKGAIYVVRHRYAIAILLIEAVVGLRRVERVDGTF